MQIHLSAPDDMDSSTWQTGRYAVQGYTYGGLVDSGINLGRVYSSVK